MKESMLKYKYPIIFFLLVFIYILGLTSLFPIHYAHEFEYNPPGNPFYLQWQEFFQRHGRFLVHIIARYTLKAGSLVFILVKSLIIFVLYFVSLKTIDSSIFKKFHLSFLMLLSVFLFINALFPFTTFMMYYSSDLLDLCNYYITASLIIIYIQYYINILCNKTEINVSLFCLLAFITGSLHEMVIACIPFIITIYLFCKVRKIAIPKWFWYSIPFFLLGFSVLLFAPGSSNRLTNYANTTTWGFFGQTINWLELGYEKYFYTLIKNIFYASPSHIWYSAPGFLPSTWYLQLLMFFFTFLNYKHYKNIFHLKIVIPILYWLFSWYTCIVMSASPMYRHTPLEFSKYFMYIALTASVYYFLKNQSKKIQIICSSVFLVVVFVGQGIQIPAIYKAKQEYLTLVEQIENGSITEVKHNPTAKMGNITIIKFGNSLYYKYPHIKFSYTN